MGIYSKIIWFPTLVASRSYGSFARKAQVEYFEFPEGLADFKKPPPLLGRKPDISRSEQQIDWVKTDAPLS